MGGHTVILRRNRYQKPAFLWKSLLVLHQSCVNTAPTGPDNSRDFIFFLHANLWKNALHCGAIFVVKTLPKAPLKFLQVNRPRQANLVLIAYASSEGSGEPAHPRSLARTFAARCYKQWVKRNLQTESQIPGPSEWLGMRSYNLSWRNARRHKFAWRGSNVNFIPGVQTWNQKPGSFPALRGWCWG